MKTSWLPEMPVNVATILLDPHVAPLSDAKIGRLFRVLSRAWIVGEPHDIPADIKPAVESLWPQYAELREALHQKHRALSEAGKRGGRPKLEREALKPDESQALSQAESTHTHTHPDTHSDPKTEIQIPTTISPPAAERQRESWVTPYAEAWQERTGGEMVVKHALKPISKLRNLHGDAAVIAAWRRYLDQTEVQFCSVTQFASKYGQWAGTAEPPRSREAEILRQLRDEGPVDDPFEAAWQSRGKALLS